MPFAPLSYALQSSYCLSSFLFVAHTRALIGVLVTFHAVFFHCVSAECYKVFTWPNVYLFFFSSSLISIFFHRKKIAAKIVLEAPENPFKQCSSLQIYMQSKHYSITAHTQSVICATNLSWKGGIGMETQYFQ